MRATDTVMRTEHYVRIRNMMVHQGDLKIEERAVNECVKLTEQLPLVFRKLNNEYFLWKDNGRGKRRAR